MAVLLAALAALFIVTLVGFAVLTLTPARIQKAMLPAAPALGAGVLVVALHWTGLVVGARIGAWIVVAAAVAVIVVQIARRRVPIREFSRPAVFLGILAAIGAIGALISWLPMLSNGVEVFVQANPSNDAFYYVATAQWLMDHSVLVTPHLGTGPGAGIVAPLYGPPAESMRIGLRLGQEMSQAAFASLTGVNPADGFMPWLGTWIIAMPGAVWAFGRAFGMRWWAILVLAAVYVSSYSLISQTLVQNADSLLGATLVPLVIGLIAATLRADRSRLPVPLWLAAIALTALVGTYTEYAPFIGPVLVAIVLVRQRAGYGRAVARAGLVIAIAIAFSPLIWFRAAQSFLVTGAIAASGGAAQGSVAGRLLALLGPWEATIRGVVANTVGAVVAVAVIVMVLVIVLGVIVGIARLETRGLAVGVLAAMGVALYLAVRSTPYVVHRASDMLVPLILLGSGVGWSVFSRRRAAAAAGRRQIVLPVVGALAVAAVLALNIHGGARAAAVTVSKANIVGSDFAAVEDWVHRYGGAGGERISVAAPVLFDQLWLTSRLGDDPAVSYVSLRGDLGYRDNLAQHAFWNGELDRYIVVGPGAFFHGDGAVVARHGRFVLLDTRKAPVTVAVPVSGTAAWSYVVAPDGVIWGPDKGEVVLLSSEPSPLPIAMRARVLSGTAPVDLLGDTGARVSTGVPDAAGQVDLPLSGVVLEKGVGRVAFDLHGRTGVGLIGLVPSPR